EVSRGLFLPGTNGHLATHQARHAGVAREGRAPRPGATPRRGRSTVDRLDPGGVRNLQRVEWPGSGPYNQGHRQEEQIGDEANGQEEEGGEEKDAGEEELEGHVARWSTVETSRRPVMRRAAILLTLLLAVVPLSAQSRLEVPYRLFTLANGLTVI